MFSLFMVWSLIPGEIGDIFVIVGILSSVFLLVDLWSNKKKIALNEKIIWSILAVGLYWGPSLILFFMYEAFYRRK